MVVLLSWKMVRRLTKLQFQGCQMVLTDKRKKLLMELGILR
ncbi:MAG TPA: hypothetical protein [Caudoviricetes sp.]|nr:MAG TPA: hypothetical protein [Caudoviricetes sp.]